MSDFIALFAQIGRRDAGRAGGKGASLGEMTQAGIPVPPGFVITANTFDRFVEEAGIKVDIDAELAKVNIHDTNSVEQASEVIRGMFDATPVPEDISAEIIRSFNELAESSWSEKTSEVSGSLTSEVKDTPELFVAVRSSATAEDSSAASWAGELETYLYTTKSTLLEHVKKCWSSLFTPRAIFYRAEKLGLPKNPVPGSGFNGDPGTGMTQHVAVAGVGQTMVASEVSGVCFTVHPVTKDHNQLIIEAGWGLGEAIVGGLITPDSYIVDKQAGTIIDTYLSEQSMKIVRKPTGGTEEVDVALEDRERQKLPNDRVLELAKLAQKIEAHYGSPQDIEWALADGELWITQSRPITTL